MLRLKLFEQYGNALCFRDNQNRTHDGGNLDWLTLPKFYQDILQGNYPNDIVQRICITRNPGIILLDQTIQHALLKIVDINSNHMGPGNHDLFRHPL